MAVKPGRLAGASNLTFREVEANLDYIVTVQPVLKKQKHSHKNLGRLGKVADLASVPAPGCDNPASPIEPEVPI